MMRACSLDRAASLPLPARTASLVLPCGSCSVRSSRLNSGVFTAFSSSPCPTSAAPSLPERRRKRHVAARCQPATHAGPKEAADPFLAASSRLQNLLAGVGNGEDEMVDSLVSDETPESRLQMQVVLSAAITGAALTISMLCGQDPWGGASASLDSLLSAILGLTAASPLIAFRAWTWTPHAAKMCPAFEDMHTGQINLQAPWYRGATPWQVALMTALEVLPITMLILPAAQGGLQASVELYSMALQSFGGPGPASVETIQLSCLALTAAVAAMTKGLELGISDSEYEVVQAAVDNSDRYYRLMAMDMTSRSGSAQRAALAFRSVAEAWMDARNDASSAAMCMCAVDVLALGGLWYATGDLTAPAVAALAINAVDAWNTYKAVAQRDAKLSMWSGPQGPSQSA